MSGRGGGAKGTQCEWEGGGGGAKRTQWEGEEGPRGHSVSEKERGGAKRTL